MDWKIADYDNIYGWCPIRKIHMQHATPKQLIETELISEKKWNEYFKFCFVRNPWDKAYSDYLWMMKDRKIKGSFKSFITKKDAFKNVLTDRNDKSYRGDHLLPQSDFFNSIYGMDFIGRFENLIEDVSRINKILNFDKDFDLHENQSLKKYRHYSLFYSNSDKKLIEDLYKNDIKELNYKFEDRRKGIYAIKKII